jgi:tight adherence protein B
MLVPFIILLFLQGRWRNRIQEQLPDALFLMARSTRAGLSLEQAVDAVGTHGAQPLRDEFHVAAEQTKLGLTAPAALRRMADRVQLVDVNALVSVVGLQRAMGGNLPGLLDRLAASVRDRNQFRGYFRAATALGRITGVALACIAPVIFIGYLFWQPEYITRFASSPAGMNALAAALMLEIIGILWLWFLLQIDY